MELSRRAPRVVDVHVGEIVLDGVAVRDEAAFGEAVRSQVALQLSGADPAILTSERGVTRGVQRAVAGALRLHGDGPVTTQ